MSSINARFFKLDTTTKTIDRTSTESKDFIYNFGEMTFLTLHGKVR